jgi:hypothetical protein
MDRLDHRYVDGKIEAGDRLHRVEIEVARGTKIVGLIERRDQSLEIVESGEIGGPGEVIDLIILEIAAIGAPIGDEEQRGKEQKEKNTAPFGHEVLW